MTRLTSEAGTRSSLDYAALSDCDLAARIAARDPEAVRLATQRNNQRLFRVAWSILHNRTDAEDAVQSAYLAGFAAIGEFEGRSSLSTWLTRIVINEALGRDRSARRRRASLERLAVVDLEQYREKLMRGSMHGQSPEAELRRAEIRKMLETAIDGLPQPFRLVFVMREIEGLTVEEVSHALGIASVTVKTRHLRARRRLQKALASELRSALSESFPFAGEQCAAMTARVISTTCS